MTDDIRYEMFLSSVRANRQCKEERQELAVVRSTPIGKHIEPEVAKGPAQKLVDCFLRMYDLSLTESP